MSEHDTAAANLRVQAQYSRRAEHYERSPVHARGEDLEWIAEAAALTGTERVLDVGAGTGHTAFALASKAAAVTGLDLTERMIGSARKLAAERGLSHVEFIVGDAARMPFADAGFDLVACRFAGHHLADPDAAVAEMARVLRPGGRILFADHIAPEDPDSDAYINRLDVLRDPSHVREWTVAQWQERFRRAGLQAVVLRSWDLRLDVSWWIGQSAPCEESRTKIDRMFRDANERIRETFHIEFAENGAPASFTLKCVLLDAR